MDSHLRLALYKRLSTDDFRILPDWSRMSMYTISATLSISGYFEG